MHVLHVTAHLGGGVGKAHAALMAVMPQEIRHTYLLLEEPRDRRYADEISAAGAEVIVASNLDDVGRRAADGDIVQFEFWNHPKLYECLARTRFPAMRTVLWSHISGLFEPLIAPGLMEQADRFVFTSPASMVLGEGLSDAVRLSVIGSGFGFERLPDGTGLAVGVASDIPPSALPGISPSRGEIGQRHDARQKSNVEIEGSGRAHPISPLEGEMSGRTEGGEPSRNAHDASSAAPICYLGTVDFIKMNPIFFDVIDRLSTTAAVWGTVDPFGALASRVAAMAHPERIRFMGQTSDPRAALSASGIFFYPLQPDHYGTAENALIEAMSLGLVPVVLTNPAEQVIVEHGVTGLVCHTAEECRSGLDSLLNDEGLRMKLGQAAANVAAERYQPKQSVEAFSGLWQELVSRPKRKHDLAAIIGHTPLDWYRSTRAGGSEEKSNAAAKGTLAHFQACFPDDSCWADQTA